MSSASLLKLISEFRKDQEEKDYNEAIEKMKKCNNRQEKLHILSELYSKYPVDVHDIGSQLTLWKPIYKRN
jgi:flagellar biosynthesis chaperone FliJ